MGRVFNVDITERVNATDSVDANVISQRIDLSNVIPFAKKAIITELIVELTVDNAIKVTELISKIKELFSDDPETCNVVINIIMSVTS